MALPLLEYSPSSQNQRVEGYEIPGDEQSRIYSMDTVTDAIDMDAVINAAYRQIFHEQQMLKANRQVALESQLRSHAITVRDFIRGLATSEAFRNWNYEVNNNYRFVELCIQRILGRNIYDEREKLAWSTLLATQGLQGFISHLLDSDEYIAAFGDHVVPYQRRRVLPQHDQGELPFERVPRYDQDYLNTLTELGYDFSSDRLITQAPFLEPSPAVRKAAGLLTLG
ncbi:phycobilisome rod-core linker polypeptide CpcG, partial [filamentous cyanobacterium CCP5]